MKTSAAAFALSLVFVLSQAITAEDLVRSSPASQRTASAPAKANATVMPAKAGVRNVPAHVGAPKVGGQRDWNVPRNYPVTARPIPREQLASNTLGSAENFRSQPLGNQRRHKVAPPAAGPQNTATDPPNTNINRQSYADALKRFRHDRHDRDWWRRHCQTIVVVNTGYYYLDAGYWYPAYGYDPTNSYYDEDGPIYTYGNLLPDQVIVNVQQALREAGYYVGQITGSLGPATRAALANFQRDYGLVITGAVDEPTVQTLGLM